MKLAYALIALCICITAYPQEKSASKTNSEPVFIGYLYRSPTNINFKLYTHLCHAFITANEDGVIRTNRNVPGPELIRQAHAAGVKVLLSLGGWGWDKQFAAIMKNKEAEEHYALAVLQIVDRFDYDGIDLDWEYPDTTEEVPGFRGPLLE